MSSTGMSDVRLHARSFDLRFYEMDRRGEATPLTMLSLFEETAFTHCELAGWDVYRLVGAGYGWVLLRGCMEMHRYPAYREAFRVETWLSETRRFYGTREYRVVSERGEELGYARSLWAFFSLERKRPVPILEDFLRAWSPDGRAAGPLGLDEVEGPSEAPASSAFEVRASEIDTNGHVNNINYLAWALDSVARQTREGLMLASVRGQYKREVTFGSSVRLAARPEGQGYRHGVFAKAAEGETEYLAAAGRTDWRPHRSGSVPIWSPGLSVSTRKDPAA